MICYAYIILRIDLLIHDWYYLPYTLERVVEFKNYVIA